MKNKAYYLSSVCHDPTHVCAIGYMYISSSQVTGTGQVVGAFHAGSCGSMEKVACLILDHNTI
jgi:hypothetical protein